MITSLVLAGFVSFANADDALVVDPSNQTTSYGTAVSATRLDMIDQQLGNLKIQQAELEANLKKTVRTVNWRIGQLKAMGATSAEVVADPLVASLTAENTDLTAQNEALKSLIAEFEGRISELENAPAPEPQVVHDTNTVINTVEVEKTVVFQSGTHFNLIAGETIIFAKPLKDEQPAEGMKGRTDLGVRFSWALSDENHQVAIDSGVGFGSGGIMIHGAPTFLFVGKSSSFGIGLGIEYSCDGWFDGRGDGRCFIEHTGGLGQATYSKSFGAVGLDVKAGLLINHVQTPTEHGPQVEGFIGIGGHIGRMRSNPTFVEDANAVE